MTTTKSLVRSGTAIAAERSRGGALSEDFPGHLTGFQAGSLVAGYRLEAQVGVGGMAVVFRARDERLGRLVALKILAPALAADAAFRRRFIAESRAAAAVDDPHIIPVYEAGEAAGVLFIAMRFVRGGDLRQVLGREGPLPSGRVAAFISPVASALDAAHRAGLVHRDVKPANILVDARQDRPDHVYLSDFGVSKGAISSVSLTGAGHFVGTADYSAPEQIQGWAVDGRTDQYALACVAYQLLTGATPFERDQGMAVLLAHLSQPPPPLSSRRPDLPGAVDAVLARGMAKAPEKRYGSCREFAEALREALGLAPYHSLGSAPAADHPRIRPAAPQPEFSGPDLAGTGKAAVLGGPAAAATADWAPGGEPTSPADVPAAAVIATGAQRQAKAELQTDEEFPRQIGEHAAQETVRGDGHALGWTRFVKSWISWAVFTALVVTIIIAVVVSSHGPRHSASTGAGHSASTGAGHSASTGAGHSASTGAGQSALTMGQSVNVTSAQTGDDGAAIVTLSGAQVTTQPVGGAPAPANGYYVVFTVKATATANGFIFAGDYFYAVVSGKQYNQDSGNGLFAFSNSQLNKAPTLNKGQSATGQLAFDIPAQHGVIVFIPGWPTNNTPAASWSF
jgi:hypothetical protein